MNTKQDENQFNFLFGIPQNANAKIKHNSLDRIYRQLGRQQYIWKPCIDSMVKLKRLLNYSCP